MWKTNFGGALVVAAISALSGSPIARAQSPEIESNAPASVEGFAADYTGDATRGRYLFGQCSACHEVGPSAKHRSGPQLNAILDRPAGAAEGFAYSLPLTALGLRGLVWSEDALDIYLRRPEDLIHYTEMPHVGIDSAQDRADLIAYLRDPEAGGRPGAPSN